MPASCKLLNSKDVKPLTEFLFIMTTSTLSDAKINSMTAFARVEGDNALGSFAWELRSVNHRYLETQFKLPEKLKSLEPLLRERLRKTVARGKIECSLYFKASDNEQSLVINQGRVSALLDAAEKIADQALGATPLTRNEILQWPGVLQPSEIDLSLLTELLLQSFDQALVKLVEARGAEGARMAALIYERLDLIDQLSDQLKQVMPGVLNDYQQRIETRLEQLKVEVDHDRLAQEIVMLAQKVDIAEELDRLNAHTAEVRITLAKPEPCGRRLDFLMQELNREANTLGSKSIATDNSQGAVNLKVLIEQMREQVQNIE